MPRRRMRHPNELFVGDLSYFCKEHDLIELFERYGVVADSRVKRSDTKGKTLMYGFVRMENLKAALSAATDLNGSIFMGRKLKVELSLTNIHNSPAPDVNQSNFVQVHVSFSSQFPNDAVVEPEESKIRRLFEPYCEIVDIVVKDYTVHLDNRQEGYAFVTITNQDDATVAAMKCNNTVVDGILFMTAISHRSRSWQETQQMQQPMQSQSHHQQQHQPLYSMSSGATVSTAGSAPSLTASSLSSSLSGSSSVTSTPRMVMHNNSGYGEHSFVPAPINTSHASHPHFYVSTGPGSPIAASQYMYPPQPIPFYSASHFLPSTSAAHGGINGMPLYDHVTGMQYYSPFASHQQMDHNVNKSTSNDAVTVTSSDSSRDDHLKHQQHPQMFFNANNSILYQQQMLLNGHHNSVPSPFYSPQLPSPMSKTNMQLQQQQQHQKYQQNHNQHQSNQQQMFVPAHQLMPAMGRPF